MKEKRDRLFKRGRPYIRQLQIMEDGKYSKDLGILWVAHNREPFYQFPEKMTKEDFAAHFESIEDKCEVLVVDDFNKEYKSGVGPIAVVFVHNDTWRIEPHTVLFPWATTRNKLRAAVAFLQMARYKKIGVCVVKTIEALKPLFDKCTQYGVLQYVGKIPHGDERGDEYIYSVRGKKT